ncbi:adenosine deaminase, partial [Amaricoccus sp. HAR-UPW-R2A-40]
EKGVDLTRLFDASGAYAWTDFADFLRVYEAACAVLVTPDDFIRSLAAEKGVDLTRLFDASGAYAWTDFADFLRVYEAACA